MFPTITDDPRFYLVYPLLLEYLQQGHIEQAIALIQQEKKISSKTFQNLLHGGSRGSRHVEHRETSPAIEEILQCVRDESLGEYSFDDETLITFSLTHLDYYSLPGPVDNCSTALATSTFHGLSVESMDPANKSRDVGLQMNGSRDVGFQMNGSRDVGFQMNGSRGVGLQMKCQQILASQEHSKYVNFVSTCVFIYLNFHCNNPHPLYQKDLAQQLLSQCREMISACPFSEPDSQRPDFPKVIASLLSVYVALIGKTREDNARLSICWEQLKAHVCFPQFQDAAEKGLEERITELVGLKQTLKKQRMGLKVKFPTVKLNKADSVTYAHIQKACNNGDSNSVIYCFNKKPYLLDVLPLELIFCSLAYCTDLESTLKITTHEIIGPKISDSIRLKMKNYRRERVSKEISSLFSKLDDVTASPDNLLFCFEEITTLVGEIKLLEPTCVKSNLEFYQPSLPMDTGILLMRCYVILTELEHIKSVMSKDKNKDNDDEVVQTGFLYFKEHFTTILSDEVDFPTYAIAYLSSYLFYLKENPQFFSKHSQNIEYIINKVVHASWVVECLPVIFHSISFYLKQMSTQSLSIKRTKNMLKILRTYCKDYLEALIKDSRKEGTYSLDFNSFIIGIDGIIANLFQAAHLAYQYIQSNTQENAEFGFTFPNIQELMVLANNYLDILNNFSTLLKEPEDEFYKNILITFLNDWNNECGEFVLFRQTVDGLYNDINEKRQRTGDQLILQEHQEMVQHEKTTLDKQQKLLEAVTQAHPPRSEVEEAPVMFNYSTYCHSFLEKYRNQLTLKEGLIELKKLKPQLCLYPQESVFMNFAKFYIGISMFKFSSEFKQFKNNLADIMRGVQRIPRCTKENLCEQLTLKNILFATYLPPRDPKPSESSISLHAQIQAHINALVEDIPKLFRSLEIDELSLVDKQYIHQYLVQSQKEINDFTQQILVADEQAVLWYKNRYHEYIEPKRLLTKSFFQSKDIRNLYLSRIMNDFECNQLYQEEGRLEQVFERHQPFKEPAKWVSLHERLVGIIRQMPPAQALFVFGSAAAEFATQGFIQARDIDLILVSTHVDLIKEQLLQMGAVTTCKNYLMTFHKGQLGEDKVDVLIIPLLPTLPFSISSFCEHERNKPRLSLSNMMLEYCADEDRFNIYDLNNGLDDLKVLKLRIENLDRLQPDYFPCILDKFLRVGINGKAQIDQNLRHKMVSWDGRFPSDGIKKHFCILILKYLSSYYCESDKLKLKRYCTLLTTLFFGEMIYKLCPSLKETALEDINTWVMRAQEAIQAVQVSCKDDSLAPDVDDFSYIESNKAVTVATRINLFKPETVEDLSDDGFCYDL